MSGDEHHKEKVDGCKQHINQLEYLTKMYNEESGKGDRHTPNTGFLKIKLAIYLRRWVYNSCVLIAMTHGAETWTLTKQAQNKLAAEYTKMDRRMLNITYKDIRTNVCIREGGD